MKASNQNLFSVFRRHFPEDTSKTLLMTPDGATWSYADALEESGRMARCLSDLGLHAGDRVTVQIRKSPEAVWLFLACLRGGFIFHPLNMDYQLDELVYFVDNAEPSAIICDPEKETLFRELTRHRECTVMTLAADGSGQFSDAIREMPPAFRVRDRKATDIAVLLYTSGTTGVPKGAKLSHGNLAANMLTLIDSWGFTASDCLLHALPVYHAHGLFVALGCVLMSGSSMVFLPRFDADTVLAVLPDCTVMMGVPTYYSRLADDPRFDRALCAGMRLFISGSAPLSEALFEKFRERSGHVILERYGMTETCMNTSNPLHGERRPGSVGPALPGISVRVVDDNGVPLPAGTVGLLEVSGPNVFAGYWRMKKQSAREFTADGYFRTGDKALIEADGYVSIIGRAKDMIISGGLNVYPREVEKLLDSFSEVAESAVIGVPHPDFGEGVVAVVVPAGDGELPVADLIAQMRPRLAAYKLPKEIFVVPALPRNSLGKVQKARLREQYAATFVSA